MSQKRAVLLNWVIPGIAAVIVAAIVLAWQWPQITGATSDQATSQPTLAQAGSLQPFTLQDNASGTGLAQSADHVRVTALRRGDTVTAQITVDHGWHINANPASLKFLIPTQLSLASQGTPLATTVDYPQGQDIDVGLKQPIRVFSNRVNITAQATDAPADGPVEAIVRVQACSNKGRCLMPSTIRAQALTTRS